MLLAGTELHRSDMPSYTTESAYPEKIDAIKQEILNAKLQAQAQPVQQADLGNKQSGGTTQWQ